ncbi:hypothetical protein GCM10027020_31490 [Nocardioides salsibiostraticola]
MGAVKAPARIRRATLAACLTGFLALTACTAPIEPERISGPLAEDPLTAVTPGPLLLDLPSKSRVASFGGVVLCSTRPGADIQLDRVRYDFSVAPVLATAWMRAVPTVDDRTEGRDFDWRPLTVTQGFPPETFKQGPYLGEFTKDLEDYDIVQLCAGVANLAAPRQELVTAVKAEAEGVALERMMVDYHVGTTDYTLTIPVDAKVCGTEVC